MLDFMLNLVGATITALLVRPDEPFLRSILRLTLVTFTVSLVIASAVFVAVKITAISN